jgi:hypothetical protein
MVPVALIITDITFVFTLLLLYLCTHYSSFVHAPFASPVSSLVITKPKANTSYYFNNAL